jgi:hypothetical protein
MSSAFRSFPSDPWLLGYSVALLLSFIPPSYHYRIPKSSAIHKTIAVPPTNCRARSGVRRHAARRTPAASLPFRYRAVRQNAAAITTALAHKPSHLLHFRKERAMKLTYDPRYNIAYLRFHEKRVRWKPSTSVTNSMSISLPMARFTASSCSTPTSSCRVRTRASSSS